MNMWGNGWANYSMNDSQANRSSWCQVTEVVWRTRVYRWKAVQVWRVLKLWGRVEVRLTQLFIVCRQQLWWPLPHNYCQYFCMLCFKLSPIWMLPLHSCTPWYLLSTNSVLTARHPRPGKLEPMRGWDSGVLHNGRLLSCGHSEFRKRPHVAICELRPRFQISTLSSACANLCFVAPWVS